MQTLLIFLLLAFSPPYHPEVTDPFIIVSKETNQLAFFDNGKLEKVYRVATGATQDLTPAGLFTVTVKAKDPYYRKKDIPGGDPKNPLGSRWIGFDAKGTDGRIYGIHGTNQPSSIGENVSQGCIRSNNNEVEQLYEQVPIGAKILIVENDRDFLSLYEDYVRQEMKKRLQ
ncbi:transpeptidase [Thalassobacillus devorans]|uniref:Transpeptidase n=1 Tax=Thalassobacillus devorans TaxID=279813 RepID=A0ABQ1PB20_9BACI|nr:L,D-transpeptidase [Thalassobacillus devorans]NIK29566.1 lipoprotein-anchoring transpeptidase ErfK/SrfK [Thalassobacillus devorans]GGC91058.1 transpeptidase [Thalassobacillus devorans]